MLITIVVVALGSMSILISRRLSGKWMNYLSLYSAGWSFSICAYEIALIHYYSISGLAWTYIFAAWIAIYVGGCLVFLQPAAPSSRIEGSVNMRWVAAAILVFTLLGALGAALTARELIREFGSLANAYLKANLVYQEAVGGELYGVSYIGSLGQAACCLAGAYTARLGRLTLIAILPLLETTIGGLLTLQRTGAFMAAALFILAFALSPRPNGFRARRWQVVAAVLLLMGGFAAITLIRGASQRDALPGETATLDKADQAVPGTAAFYMYISSPPVVFSEFTRRRLDRGAYLGRYTFAPIFRVLKKFGFPTPVPFYQELYSTPVQTNQASYLKNILSDFGPVGIFIVPFVFGIIGAILTRRLRSERLLECMISAHFFLVIGMSWVSYYLMTGYFVISLVVCMAVATMMRSRPARKLNSGATSAA
jgi:hypothetical protein